MIEHWQRVTGIPLERTEPYQRIAAATGASEPWQVRTVMATGEPWQRVQSVTTAESGQRRKLVV